MNQENSLSIWQDQKKIEEVKKIYGKDLTDAEFFIFLQIGKSTNLNPFLREIWAMKYGSAPASIFIGRDGYRRVAQSSPDYDYHIVDAVYAGDEFSIVDGVIHHTYSIRDRGGLAGAYCIVKRRSASKAMFSYVDLKEYGTGRSLWGSKPATMIKKVAEAQGLRMAFQSLFAGTYDESEAWMEDEKRRVQKPEVEVVQEKITSEQGEEIAKLWPVFVDLEPNIINKNLSEAIKRKKLTTLYGKRSSADLTRDEADDFIEKLKNKISELSVKKIPVEETVISQEKPEVEVATIDFYSFLGDPGRLATTIEGLNTRRELEAMLADLDTAFEGGVITATSFEEAVKKIKGKIQNLQQIAEK